MNTGHAIQVNVPAGNSMLINNRSFALKQFHFHAPSENTIGGKSFAMEAHFVHADAGGNLAVVGGMFELGDANGSLANLWQQLPGTAGTKHVLASPFSALSLLPDDKMYYRYNGSSTTPPCTEGVLWLVMKKAIPVSRAQVDGFKAVMHHVNNRPLQPVNARAILY